MPKVQEFASAGTKGPPISEKEAQQLLDLILPPTKEELEERAAVEVAAKTQKEGEGKRK